MQGYARINLSPILKTVQALMQFPVNLLTNYTVSTSI